MGNIKETQQDKIAINDVLNYADAYRMADELTESGLHYDDIFNELKNETGLSKDALRRIFRARLTDIQIIESIRSKPPHMNMHQKCMDLKRLSLGQVKSTTCRQVLFNHLMRIDKGEIIYE